MNDPSINELRLVIEQFARIPEEVREETLRRHAATVMRGTAIDATSRETT